MVNLNISLASRETLGRSFNFTISNLTNFDVRLWKGRSFKHATSITALPNKTLTAYFNENLFVSFVAKKNGTAQFKFDVIVFESSSETTMLKIILGSYFGVVGFVVVIFCIWLCIYAG